MYYNNKILTGKVVGMQDKKYKLYVDKELYKIAGLEAAIPGSNLTANWQLSGDLHTADSVITFPHQTIDHISVTNPLAPVINFAGHGSAEFVIPAHSKINILDLLPKVEPIIEKVKYLELNAPAFKKDLFLTVLGYIWSRGGNLNADISHDYPMGYGYAFIDRLVSIQDNTKGSHHPRHTATVLSFLVESGYLTKQLKETAHACPKCASINVLLRDGCTKCGSVDVREETIVHHYKCTHQAPESHFINLKDGMQGEYICPKCNEVLKHFGMDYDKPGQMQTCNTCGNIDSETVVQGRCTACSHNFAAHDSNLVSIFDYQLTPLGQKALFNNDPHSFNLKHFLESAVDVISFADFLMVGTKMAALEERGHVNNMVLYVKFRDENQNNHPDSEHAQMVLSLGQAISRFTRQTDSVSYYLGTLYILFSGIDQESIQTIQHKVADKLSEFFDKDVTKMLEIEAVELKHFLNVVQNKGNQGN